MLSMLKKLFSSNNKEESDIQYDELWVMIKESDFFRDEEHIELIDNIAELVEGSELGDLDGHSSGKYQLEINFYGVSDYPKARSLIKDYFSKNHPDLEFIISNEYETTYEKT